MLRSLLLATLAAFLFVPPASAQSREFNCGLGATGDHEVYIRVDEDADAKDPQLNVTVSFDYQATPYQNTFVLDGTEDVFVDCDLSFIAGLDVVNPAPNLDPAATLVLPEATPIFFTFEDVGRSLPPVTFTYVQCSAGGTPRSFYCPTVDGTNVNGFPDMYFVHDVTEPQIGGSAFATPIHPIPNEVSSTFKTLDQYPDEYYGSTAWVAPYDLNTLCSPTSTVCGGPLTGTKWPVPIGLFVTQQTAPFQFTQNELIQYPSDEWLWDLDGQALTFAPGAQVLANGDAFDIDGMDLVPETGQTWRGLQIQANNTATLTDATLSGVSVPTMQLGGEGAALEVIGSYSSGSGATVTLSNTTVSGTQNGHGILATNGASVTLSNESEARDNALYGAKALSNATVTMDTDSKVFLNIGGGLYASGGFVFALDGEILDNQGPGLFSNSGGADLLREMGGPGNAVTVSNNRGGLYARQQGAVNSVVPVCAQPPCGASNRHTLLDNAVNIGDFDASALGASIIHSQQNFWGPGVTQQSDLAVEDDGSSIVQISPNATSTSLTGGGTRTAFKGGDGPPRLGEVFALIAEAEVASARGEVEGAHRALSAALATAFTDDEVAAAYAAAGRVLGREGSPLIEAWLAAHATEHTRVPALAALGRIYERTERLSEARAAFTNLAETGDARGPAGLVRLAAAERREASALAAFGALLQTDAGEQMIADAATLLLLAFPDMDLSAARMAAPQVASKGADGANTQAELSVSPNPSAGLVTVRFTLAEAGSARLTILDVLGREVAVLADRAFDAGSHTAALDTSTLAPGAYVLRLDGAEAITTTRLTAIR